MPSPTVSVTHGDLYQMVTLVYARWANESDLLEQVKTEQDDGSPDWSSFHAEHLKRHTAAEAKWKSLLDRNLRLLNLNSR